MEKLLKDWINIEEILVKDEEDWNKQDRLLYSIILQKNEKSFYSNISEGAKRYIIYEILQEIPEEEQFLIFLVYYKNYSYRKCSNILGVPKSTIHFKISNILKKMKKIVERKYGYKIF